MKTIDIHWELHQYISIARQWFKNTPQPTKSIIEISNLWTTTHAVIGLSILGIPTYMNINYVFILIITICPEMNDDIVRQWSKQC